MYIINSILKGGKGAYAVGVEGRFCVPTDDGQVTHSAHRFPHPYGLSRA